MLATLEHIATRDDLTQYHVVGSNTLQGYLTETWYLTAMPQMLNPFRSSEASINLFLTYNEDNDCCCFSKKDERGFILTDIEGSAVNLEAVLRIHRSALNESEWQNSWLNRDYQQLLDEYADKQGVSKKYISIRFGELNFKAMSPLSVENYRELNLTTSQG